MKFTHYNLGNKKRGEIVEISLSGSAANVRLMNSSNFSNYKRRKEHRYFGGLAKKSPVRLPIPQSGHWHVTVDMAGLRGSVRSSIRMLPNQLPPIRDRPLSSIPTLVQGESLSDTNGVEREFDVFISHASEDKEAIVRDLAHALRDSGLSVWYDEFELKIGDSLRRKIDKGLAKSRFGIVVLSQAFFGKGWPNYELDGLVTRSVTGEQVLLPIWHNISKEEVIGYSPSLADKLARNTSTHTVNEIAKEILNVIRG